LSKGHAFYDIRREIENSGLNDISTDKHVEDLAIIKSMISKIKLQMKNNEKFKTNLLKTLDTQNSEFVTESQGAIKALEESINKGLSIVEKSAQRIGNIPANTIKKTILTDLQYLKDELLRNLTVYIDQKLSKVPFFDTNLITELGMLDADLSGTHFKVMFDQKASVFEEGYRAGLLYHFKRVKRDIDAQKSEFNKKWNEDEKIDGLSIVKYKKSLGKKVAKSNADLRRKLTNAEKVKVKLARIVINGRSYSRNDDGSENKTAILDSSKEIADQVYGKWGSKFLKYTTKNARKLNLEFNQKYSEYSKGHLLIKEKRAHAIKSVNDMSHLMKVYACQDARPRIELWNTADSLSQAAYDFIATNKDLFHSGYPKSGFFGYFFSDNVYESIQDHHKSSYYAKKYLRGEKIEIQKKEKYLGSTSKRDLIEDDYQDDRSSYKSDVDLLGSIMIEVESNRKRAALIQQLEVRYKCPELLLKDD
jgi:hypothetical protein